MILGDVPLTVRSRLEYRILRYDDSPEVHKRGYSIDYFSGEGEGKQRLQVRVGCVRDA